MEMVSEITGREAVDQAGKTERVKRNWEVCFCSSLGRTVLDPFALLDQRKN